MKIGLVSINSNVNLKELQDKKAYQITKIAQEIQSADQRIIIIEYDEEKEVESSPESLVIGNLPKRTAAGTEYNQAYVLYDNKQWQVISDQQIELFTLFSDIKSDKVKTLKNLLEDLK